MINNSTIVISGAAGFIGSVFVQFLNEQGFYQLVLLDDFSDIEKRINWESKKYIRLEDRKSFLNKLSKGDYEIDFIVHLGARTDTTEFNYAIHEELNLEYSKALWNYATQKCIPFIYASSAATYGSGEFGYNDRHDIIQKLRPLNPYGVSKNEFDKWAIDQPSCPPFWTGLKFFNVYGPNEAHKGRMASVIFHAFNQIKTTGKVKLFKSYRSEYQNGKQLRDFIYVKDLVAVINWMLNAMLNNQWNSSKNGLYNLGTGKARTFYDLAVNTFIAQGIEPNIEFVDMPEDIRDKYQYFTEANMTKLLDAGYSKPFLTLEEGLHDYVVNYLLTSKSL